MIEYMDTVDYINLLAQEIRAVDGNNSLGAAALAEALIPFICNTLPPKEFYI